MSDKGYGSMPKPIPNDGPSAHDKVVADTLARKQHGLDKYGSLLQTGNGRDQLQDAYEEALDLCAYLAAALMEREQQANVMIDEDGQAWVSKVDYNELRLLLDELRKRYDVDTSEVNHIMSVIRGKGSPE